jgi:hypothetical protein
VGTAVLLRCLGCGCRANRGVRAWVRKDQKVGGEHEGNQENAENRTNTGNQRKDIHTSGGASKEYSHYGLGDKDRGIQCEHHGSKSKNRRGV